MLIASVIFLLIASYASYGITRDTDFHYAYANFCLIAVVVSSMLYMYTGVIYVVLNIAHHPESMVIYGLSGIGLAALLVFCIYISHKIADSYNEEDRLRIQIEYELRQNQSIH